MLKPCKVLTETELQGLRLISKTRNGPYKPIYKEELPKILYGNSPRQVLGSTWFNKYTKPLEVVKTCQGCGNTLRGKGERHELYGLYQMSLLGLTTYIIKLEGVMLVCSKCHKAIHYGFSTRLGMGLGYLPLVAPESKAFKIGPWSKAEYLLVDNELFNIK